MTLKDYGICGMPNLSKVGSYLSFSQRWMHTIIKEIFLLIS